MNTLQKISELEGKVSMLEKMVVTVPKLTQDLTRMSGDLEQINQAVKNIVDAVNKRTSDLSKIDNVLVTRQMALEQSIASLSKTAAALVAELTETKLLNQENVMTRLRKSDERADQDRVEAMIKQGVLKEGDKITKESLVVVSQVFTAKDGTKDTVSEFRSVDMSSPEIEEKIRETYIGKGKSEVVELNLDDGALSTTILQVYDYVQVLAQGSETGAQMDAAKPEATQQQV